ncbi:hypothetical protein [Microbacterium sp. SLBN-111]|uniref:hypothetical protein n=1 Tax=Microbacterium sp. SLBN-111 TaxID=3377733 RepID=UPI003C770BAA
MNACLGTTGSTGDLFTSWQVPDIRPGTYQVFVFTQEVWVSTKLTVQKAGDASPSPSPTDSAAPVVTTPTPTPTSTPTAAPQLAASGTPDVGTLVPWGVAALAVAAALGVHRLRSRAKG